VLRKWPRPGNARTRTKQIAPEETQKLSSKHSKLLPLYPIRENVALLSVARPESLGENGKTVGGASKTGPSLCCHLPVTTQSKKDFTSLKTAYDQATNGTPGKNPSSERQPKKKQKQKISKQLLQREAFGGQIPSESRRLMKTVQREAFTEQCKLPPSPRLRKASAP